MSLSSSSKMGCNTYFKLWKTFVVWFLYQGIWDDIQCTSTSENEQLCPDRWSFFGILDDIQCTSTSENEQLCPDGWSFFGTKCYKGFGLALSERETWNSSNSKCLDMKTSMVSIHSKEEEEFITRMFLDQGGSERVWLGLYEHMYPSGAYSKWSDNSTLVYSNWAKNQPSHTFEGKNEECVILNVPPSTTFGQWNDESCDNRHAYACQISLENTCVLNPCQHGAICTQDGSKRSFNCSCTQGYTGRTCEEKILCASNSCNGHGFCSQDGLDGIIRCSCLFGYKGLACEEKILCDSNSCNGHGFCSQDGFDGIIRCSCLFGYKGLTCDEKILCDGNSCNGHGLCSQDGLDGTIRCSCTHGYTGLACDKKILCNSNSCNGQGLCSQDGLNGIIRCSCIAGYKGLTCDETVITYEIEHVGGEDYIRRGNVVVHVEVDVKVH